MTTEAGKVSDYGTFPGTAEVDCTVSGTAVPPLPCRFILTKYDNNAIIYS